MKPEISELLQKGFGEDRIEILNGNGQVAVSRW